MNDEIRQRKESAIWRKLAAGYDGRTLETYREAYCLSIEKTLAVLQSGQRVLEIGCGTGIITLAIASQVGQVVATDLTPEMVAVAQGKAREKGIENIEFRVCDGYHLADADSSFDAVLLFNLLHVVEDPAALLSEAYRLLKPGGCLITATDCYAEPVPWRLRMTLIMQRLLKLTGIVPVMSFFHKQDLYDLIQKAGFTLGETADLHPAPPNHYVFAEKPA